MTIDEAKRLFAQYIDYDAETPNYYDMEEACKVAIQALEQEQVRTQMSSADCISRQTQLENGDRAVSLNAVKDILKMANVEEFDIVAYRNIMQLPPVKPQERTGHWIAHPKGIYAHLICDKCLSNAPYDCRTDYCPNCGCRMVEPQERSE